MWLLRLSAKTRNGEIIIEKTVIIKQANKYTAHIAAISMNGESKTKRIASRRFI